MEKVLSGELKNKDLAKVVTDAEEAVTALKDEIARFRSLTKSYEKGGVKPTPKKD